MNHISVLFLRITSIKTLILTLIQAGSLEYVSVVKTSTAAGRLNAGSLKNPEGRVSWEVIPGVNPNPPCQHSLWEETGVPGGNPQISVELD